MPIYNDFGKINIDDARIDETCNAYFKWKNLNTYISNNSHRGINMPDAISEPMGCYCLGLLWNKGSEVGDAMNPTTEMEIAGIIFRTITIDKNGRPTEAMPFKSFEFEELISTPWEESSIREDFVDLKLKLFVFKEIDGVISFDRIVF